MYILGFILVLLTLGIVTDLRRGSFKDRKAHDTNPNHVKTNHSAESAFNSSSVERHIP